MTQTMHDRVREYDRLAKHYDQRLGLYTRQTIEETFRIARLTGNEVIVDVCAGTGELLQLIALHEHKGPIIGIDFSQTMLNVAARRLRGYPNIAMRLEDVTHVRLPDNYADVAFHTNALHYLKQPSQTLHEIYRILRPHGRLILVDLTANSKITRWWGALRSLFKPVYKRIYRTEEMVDLLRKAGFVITTRKQWRINFLWSVVLFEVQKPAPTKKKD